MIGDGLIEFPIAIISDIHGNVDALNVVLADIDARGVQTVICLGDTIGYGPDPLACLDRVMDRCEFMLMGNHDYASIYEPTNFNAGAEQAAYWTRRQFEQEKDVDLRAVRWEFLGNLPVRKTFGDGMMCVHASPRRPINEYIFPDDVNTSPVKMDQIFERVKRCCFVGHTHVQGVFTDDPDFYQPDELDGEYTFSRHEKAVVNVGSVGQPRDRDPRSGYVVLHEDRVEFVRVEYDIQNVVDKINEVPELNDFFGQRLLEGR